MTKTFTARMRCTVVKEIKIEAASLDEARADAETGRSSGSWVDEVEVELMDWKVEKVEEA